MKSIQAISAIQAVTEHVDDTCVLQQYNTSWFTNSYNTDCEARLDVVKRYFLSVNNGKINPILILISNEEWFQLSRYVDSQNNRFHELTKKVPLKDVKSRCAVCYK
jgi:hypothetical protein